MTTEPQIDPNVDLDGVIEHDAVLSQRQVIALLADFDRAREWEKQAKENKDFLAAQIKRYLEANPDEKAIRDGENGLTASLSWRNGPAEWDIRNMPDDMIIRLASFGALTMDRKVFEAMGSKDVVFVDAKAYSHPGGAVASLQVKRS